MKNNKLYLLIQVIIFVLINMNMTQIYIKKMITILINKALAFVYLYI